MMIAVKRSFFIFLYVFGFLNCALAAEEKLTHFGHDLSSSTELLPAGKCTVGFVSAACGVNDKLSIGSSPWMYWTYEMYSVAARALIDENAEGDRWAWQGIYFKTYGDHKANTLETPYQMEALWNELLRSYKLNDHYTLTYNFHINYYFNQKMPFSLRRPYYHANPVQINFSTLHQVDLYDNWFMQGEFGIIDLLNNPIHLHGGSSIGRNFKSWFFYFGFSFTPSVQALFHTSRKDYQFEYKANGLTYDNVSEYDRVEDDYSIHPEINIQIFF